MGWAAGQAACPYFHDECARAVHQVGKPIIAVESTNLTQFSKIRPFLVQ